MIDTSIINKYLKGESLSALSKEYNISTYILKKELISKGIKIRSRNEQNKFSPQNQRVYKVNDLYFSNQNANMAYLLGFYAADGCVYKDKNAIKLTLSSVDRDFLEKVKKELDSDYPIRDYETKDGYTNSEFIFSSLQIKKDFSDYGITPLKTYNLKFPEKLKKEYYIDFIRGYFDGDGCVSSAGKSAIRWQICAYNKDILKRIVDILEEYNIPKVSVQNLSNRNIYTIQYSTNATKKIFDILYYNNCLCLERKYNKFKTLVK